MAFLVEAVLDIFGVITEEMPKFELVEKTPTFEIRQYGPALVAETAVPGSETAAYKPSNEAFFVLAGYIGALSAPKNEKAGAGEKIAMTAPVTMANAGEKIAMTAPVTMANAGEKIAMTAPVTMANACEKIAMTAPVTMANAGEKISMTAPVTMADSGQASQPQVMSFILPSKYTIDTVPRPTDPRVTVKEIPGKRVGACVFSGTGTPSEVARKADQLKQDLESAGHKIKGAYVAAFYNSPYAIPFLRRNEVWYELDV